MSPLSYNTILTGRSITAHSSFTGSQYLADFASWLLCLFGPARFFSDGLSDPAPRFCQVGIVAEYLNFITVIRCVAVLAGYQWVQTDEETLSLVTGGGRQRRSVRLWRAELSPMLCDGQPRPPSNLWVAPFRRQIAPSWILPTTL